MKIKDMTREQKKIIREYPCTSKSVNCDNCPLNVNPDNTFYGCAGIALKSKNKAIVKAIGEYSIDMRRVR